MPVQAAALDEMVYADEVGAGVIYGVGDGEEEGVVVVVVVVMKYELVGLDELDEELEDEVVVVVVVVVYCVDEKVVTVNVAVPAGSVVVMVTAVGQVVALTGRITGSGAE